MSTTFDVLILTRQGVWKPVTRDADAETAQAVIDLHSTPCKHSGPCRFPFHQCGHQPVTVTTRS